MDAFQTLMREIERGELASLYLIVGPERFFAERIVGKLRERLGLTDRGALNYEQLHAHDLPVSELLVRANTLPMFGERRLVVVDAIDDWKSAELEQLIDYVRRPSATTCLLLLAEKMDRRKSIFKEIAKHHRVISAATVVDRQLPGFCALLAREKGLTFNHQLAQQLAGAIGSDLIKLDRTLDLLLTYLGDQRTVTGEDIEAVVSGVSEESIFVLLNALITGSPHTVLALTHRLLGQGEQPLFILAMLSRQIRLLLRTRELIDRGVALGEMGRLLGQAPYQVQNLLTQAKQTTLQSLGSTLRFLSQLDRELKGRYGAGIKAEAIVENGIVRLIAGRFVPNHP